MAEENDSFTNVPDDDSNISQPQRLDDLHPAKKPRKTSSKSKTQIQKRNRTSRRDNKASTLSTQAEEMKKTAGRSKSKPWCCLCFCEEEFSLGLGPLEDHITTAGGKTKFPSIKNKKRQEPIGVKETRQQSQRPFKIGPGKQNKLIIEALEKVGRSSAISTDDQLSMCPGMNLSTHRNCALWSKGVREVSHKPLYVDEAAYKAMSQRCDFCNNFGASVHCHVETCDRVFHYPCSTASGCFRYVYKQPVFCPEHLQNAVTYFQSHNLTCQNCEVAVSLKDISDFLHCCECGNRYHCRCVLPRTNINPVVRVGWRCSGCAVCDNCSRSPHRSTDDSKLKSCDSCGKSYHINCTTTPPCPPPPLEGEWSCKNCLTSKKVVEYVMTPKGS